MIWNKLSAIIEENQSFLISSHVSPDGDCIGSQLAMYWYLTSLGKDAAIYNIDAVPHKFCFLHNADAISSVRPQKGFDVLMVLDSSNPDRLGWKKCEDMAPVIVNIDHHEDNTRFADVNIIDSAVSATGQILYRFFIASGIEFPGHIAQSLYAAIITDTGGFRFSNTNGAVLRVCAELSDKGAMCDEVYKHVYASDSPGGMLLKARIWSTLAFHLDSRVCTMEMPIRLIKEIGAEYGDSEGMADCTITAEGVQVGMLIKYREGETHFSLRSTGSIDVGAIARSIAGGGGHMNAAGCTLYMPLDKAKKHMLNILGSKLE
jgi:phosphoesterase RecJ-like protein